MAKRNFVEVVFTKECHLPRFKMRHGEVWRLRKERLKPGGFSLGGGFVGGECFYVSEGYFIGPKPQFTDEIPLGGL